MNFMAALCRSSCTEKSRFLRAVTASWTDIFLTARPGCLHSGILLHAACPFAFRQRVSSPGTGLKGDALFACPSIVWPGEKQSYLLKYGFNAGIFVHTVHTLMTEREREESAMAEAAGVFTWKKKRNTVRDQERRTLLEGLSQTRLLIDDVLDTLE